MKSRLIVNPVAGRDTGGHFIEKINGELRARWGKLDIVVTVGSGDAAEAAAEAATSGCEQLFVAGGDGTLNEVLNGVASVDGALERVTFGIIPLGTGNDFAAGLGIPPEVDAALAVLLAAQPLTVDAGLLGGRQHFVNVSAGGFIAEVSEAVNPSLKSLAGKLAYLIGGAQVLFDYEPVRAKFELTGEQGVARREFDLQTFAVCNSRFIGGGRPIAPDALIDDGWLDVCIIEAMPTADFIGLLGSVSKGSHVEDSRVSYARAREIRFEFSRSIKVNTDGEVHETDGCEYRVLPQVARFFAGDAPFSVKAESKRQSSEGGG